jgi:hypothetical protein
MNCEHIQPELAGYHFGVIDEGLRRGLEEHLLACPGCLRSFLDLKRDIETAETGPRPSPALRDRLHATIEGELGMRRSRWERPLALVFAGAAMLAAMLAVNFIAASAGAPPRGLTSSASAPAQRW